MITARHVRRRVKRHTGFAKGFRRALVRRQLIPRSVRNKFPFFRESYEATVSVSHTTGDYGITIAPYMSLFPQMASYSALFDQYKVSHYDVRWYPFMSNPNSLLVTNATGNTGTNLISGLMLRAFDPDDNTAPTSSANLLDYRKMKSSNVFKPWKTRIYPQVFKAIDGTAYGTESSKRSWIDIGNQTVVLHGLKVYIEDIGYRHASTDLAIGKFVVSVGFRCRNQI